MLGSSSRCTGSTLLSFFPTATPSSTVRQSALSTVQALSTRTSGSLLSPFRRSPFSFACCGKWMELLSFSGESEPWAAGLEYGMASRSRVSCLSKRTMQRCQCSEPNQGPGVRDARSLHHDMLQSVSAMWGFEKNKIPCLVMVHHQTPNQSTSKSHHPQPNFPTSDLEIKLKESLRSNSKKDKPLFEWPSPQRMPSVAERHDDPAPSTMSALRWFEPVIACTTPSSRPGL